jgi:hypothetical protein
MNSPFGQVPWFVGSICPGTLDFHTGDTGDRVTSFGKHRKASTELMKVDTPNTARVHLQLRQAYCDIVVNYYSNSYQ